MDAINNFSFKVNNFKCFGNDSFHFGSIRHINIIIGKNNSGKSAILDVINRLSISDYNIDPALRHNNMIPEFIGITKLNKDVIGRVFRPNTSGGGIPADNHYEFGKRLIGMQLSWRLDLTQGKFVSLLNLLGNTNPLNEVSANIDDIKQNLCSSVNNPIFGKSPQRIYAERNIIPESDSSNLGVDGHGIGVTNIIQNYINSSDLPRRLVEDRLLSDLNEIFESDAYFNRITCQRDNRTQLWEIYLEEASKGSIALSQSGSGLKTIIIVLAFLILIPDKEKKDFSQYIFCFEELENNLHPSLFRRLLRYLSNYAYQNKGIFFLTTHSSVAIDLFNKDEGAQIIHVTNDNKSATVKTIKTYFDNAGILDDLDVRASDILQSNLVIWVEGPSDRVYLNSWIHTVSNGELLEGSHYQCVFYGGRLLPHYSSKNPDSEDKLISILRLNRNAIIVMDSDKRSLLSRLNNTKKRVIKEFAESKMLSWVTRGREIENYIPITVLSKWLNKDLSGISQPDVYGDFFDYLDLLNLKRTQKSKIKIGSYYRDNKPLLAEEISRHFDINDINSTLDLQEKVSAICKKVRECN
jgi:hypothetical protein